MIWIYYAVFFCIMNFLGMITLNRDLFILMRVDGTSEMNKGFLYESLVQMNFCGLYERE